MTAKRLLTTTLVLCTGFAVVPMRAAAVPINVRQAALARYIGELHGRIRHVVVIVQENRTVDNFFHGFPGADTVEVGMSRHGPVRLHPVDLDRPVDVDHQHKAFLVEYDDGKMDGWDMVETLPQQAWDFPYAYVPRRQIEPYWDMASEYTLADHMFQSNTGPSFPAHLYLVSGQAQFVANNPNHQLTSRFAWGCDSPLNATVTVLNAAGVEVPGPYPCLDFQTLADTALSQGATWRYYAPSIGSLGSIWSAFDAIRHIRYSPLWGNVVSPETQVLTDAAKGDLPSITWVTPTAQDSDHSFPPNSAGGRELAVKGAYGPDWVASIVNAIGKGPLWNSTAIFITWDDWGGWYDHVAPPQIDRMGLGFRVPLIIVSPWVKHHYISHVHHEFGSIIKFSELAFELPSLHTTDDRADAFRDCFDFTQPPARFHPIPTLRQASFFEHQYGEEPADSDY